MKLLRSLLLATVVVLGAVSPAAAQTPQEPRAFIQHIADQVLAVLRDKSLPSQEKIDRIEQIAYQYFDFPTIARLVLARHWRSFTPEQQQEFIEEFKKHLSVTYGKNVERYRDETIEITGDRKEARGDWTVKSKIVRSGGDDVLVDYRLRQNSGQWKIIDVTIETVSLVANFRSQLQDIVASRGPAETIRLLREKNASGQSILPDEGKIGGDG